MQQRLSLKNLTKGETLQTGSHNLQSMQGACTSSWAYGAPESLGHTALIFNL